MIPQSSLLNRRRLPLRYKTIGADTSKSTLIKYEMIFSQWSLIISLLLLLAHCKAMRQIIINKQIFFNAKYIKNHIILV